MSYVLGEFPAIDSSQDELDQLCRYQPCGTALCPCPPGMRPGQLPASVQQLPELVTTGTPSWLPLLLLVVGVIALSRSRGARDW